jgi:hypothetical protein
VSLPTGSEEIPHTTHCLVSSCPVLGGLHAGNRSDVRPGDARSGGGTGIGIHAANGRTIMRLGNTTDPELAGPLVHSANLILRDETGHDRIRLLVADNGDPKIEPINGAGELIWSAP